MSAGERVEWLIVGGGLAGGRAALALRKEGAEGAVVVLGDEPDPPYERPHVSKRYLLGEEGWEELRLADDGAWASSDIELRTGVVVTSVDRADRAVVLADGSRVGYQHLLVATGSAPRPLQVPGGDLDGVLLLRTRRDGDRLRVAIEAGGRVVVIGGGWIGNEVAAVARQLGSEVTMLVAGAAPLERALGAEVGGAFTALHRGRGVDVRLGTRVRGIERTTAGLRVHLAAGDAVDGSVVLAGVGAVPRIELARAAGLDVDSGILVDDRFRTSDPAIWAVGDVAEAWHPQLGTRIRLDHWAAAYFGGTAAARSMLGRGAPYERIPYVYSDQYDSTLEWVGWAPTWERVVVRGDLAGPFLAFWLREGRVAAAMQLDTPDARKPLEALVRTRALVPPERLADPALPLEDLVGPSS
jgi:3-phenylpropionate/trans-cinnamate dioxygenase ferredoxin reductase subunit